MAVARGTVLALMSLALCGAVATAWSLEPETDAPRSRPVNLKVLATDIQPQRLGRLMKRYEKDLGVSCSYCHVENRETGKLDYVSDENPRKHTARIMIAMLDDINGKYLAQLEGDRRYAEPVTCGSCHQGRATPPAFEGWRQ